MGKTSLVSLLLLLLRKLGPLCPKIVDFGEKFLKTRVLDRCLLFYINHWQEKGPKNDTFLFVLNICHGV